MKITIYNSKPYEKEYLKSALVGHELVLREEYLSLQTTALSKDADVIIVFVNDDVSAEIIDVLKRQNPKLIGIATRATGHDNIDHEFAKGLGIKVANVPRYSPNAIAEHTIGLILALNRKLITADKRIHDNNFSLDDLVGFNLKDKTVGIVGTGKIGRTVANILSAFECNVLAYDIKPDMSNTSIKYVDLTTLFRVSDIITLHVPMNEATKYLINKKNIALMKKDVMIINTGRGGILCTADVIEGLKEGKIGYLGLDVYEKEKSIFFEDHSTAIMQDDMFARLLTFKNVLITGHQAFLTKEALASIAETTAYNINCWNKGVESANDL